MRRKERVALGVHAGDLKKTVFLILFLVVLSVAVHAVETEPEKRFVPNEIIVGLEDINSQILLSVEEAGGDVLELIPSLNAVRVSVPSSMENAFITAMKNKPRVRYVERNVVLKAVHTPNDPYWGDQWGMRIIQADLAWDIHKGSTSVTVAIIDTGIEYTHDDLSGHYVALGYDWVNNDDNPMDDNGHGTHCAGIAAAVMDNGIGVVGVAQVSIMAEKVLGADGTGTADDVAQGIVHAANQSAGVISISLGSDTSSTLIEDACQYAWNMGCILLGAAGNDDTDAPHYPSAYSTVVSVAATNRDDERARYSNYGDTIELSAPGGDTKGPYWQRYILSTYIGNGYAWAYGTSMSAPHVSGLAALVWSYDSSLNNTELREYLRSTADDLGDAGKDPYYGYGRINAYRALNELVGFELNLRVMDWDLTNSIQGAYVYVDSDVQISDANGWANWTALTGTVYVKVKWYGAWVNGTSVVMDSNKTIDVQCHIFDIVVTCVEGAQGAVLQYVNVTVYNATSITSNMIRTGITGSDGKVSLANVPNSTLTFTCYDGASPQHVIANVTRTILTENQAETITCDQNSISTSQAWGIIAKYNTSNLSLALLPVFTPKIVRYVKCLKERIKKVRSKQNKQKGGEVKK